MNQSTTCNPQQDPYISQTLDFLDAVFANYPHSDYAFRLWNGTIWQKQPNPKPSKFTITLNNPAALRRMFFPPSDTQLAQAYMLGDFDIEGSLAQALNLGKHLWLTWSWRDMIRFTYKLFYLPSNLPSTDDHLPQLSGQLHSEDRDKSAIQYHYDISNDFYQLWLDKRMVYSCACFETIHDSIDQAQETKLNYICKKLRLKPGEKLLDIGCGWGALVIHAVKHFGVTALGVTLSEKQLILAKQRVQQAGITDKCDIQLLDYRNIPESQPFDKIVSVGMVEHVGRDNLQTYFDKVYKLLRIGGVFLNHGITLLHDEFKPVKEVKNGFFAKYIFPDGDLQPLEYILPFATKANFEIRDIECLREHYALTLKNWRLKFEANEDKIVNMLGRKSYRLWRLYLLGAGWGFESGLYSIYQTLLYKSREGNSALEDLPLTRNDWYEK